MPGSCSRFAITLPVEPGSTHRLAGIVIGLGVVGAAGLVLVAGGIGRLAAVGPLISGWICLQRLRRQPRLPRAVAFVPETGWLLRYPDRSMPVALLPGSYFGRAHALLTMVDAEGARRHLWLRRPASGNATHWRRLRVLWRTNPAVLFANSPNC